METIVQPYLFFEGNCEEAIDFYCAKLGAEKIMLMRYKENPGEPPPGMVREGSEEKIMHGAFKLGESLIMASDNCCGEKKASFDGFSLSLSLPDEAAAKKAFDALAEDGEIQMPLDKTFWSPCFGMLTDKFGIGWMVTVAQECM